jgi:hypothetical protein
MGTMWLTYASLKRGRDAARTRRQAERPDRSASRHGSATAQHGAHLIGYSRISSFLAGAVFTSLMGTMWLTYASLKRAEAERPDRSASRHGSATAQHGAHLGVVAGFVAHHDGDGGQAD